MMDTKIILVTRKTRLEGLVERFNTRGQARFYIEHSGGSFDFYEREHETYYRAVDALQTTLARLGKVHAVERGFLPTFFFGEQDIVVTVGVDGLVVNTAKYLSGQLLVAANPDPAHIDGILLPFTVPQAGEAVRMALAGQARFRQVSMAQASLNDGQSLLAFNDLFVGVRSHVSARYRIAFAGKEENHSSSGLIVSTGAGSTGWLSSLINMANGMLAGFGQAGDGAPPALTLPRLDWETDRLAFVVREPFISKTSSASLVCGLVTPEQPLLVESHMPEAGVIFSDGVEADYLAFNAGAKVSIAPAPQKTRLVVA